MSTSAETSAPFRNVAIIAHVDHGKTSLVDRLLQFGGQGSTAGAGQERVMDSNALERERGITILAKTTSISWNGITYNIVDTPGHGDFGGEVERVMNMVDGVVLLVDATEGPMPQTKFVLSKALKAGLRPIVVLNKMDRSSQRSSEVETEIFDLFVSLDAKEEQMSYPTLYASAREGWAVRNMADPRADMTPLFETVLSYVPPPKTAAPRDDFRMLVSLLEYDEHLGKIITGRIHSGGVKVGQGLHVVNQQKQQVEEGKVLKILARRGMHKIPLDEAVAGDIVGLAGFARASVTDTVTVLGNTTPIPASPIEPPVISMYFSVNDGPLAGKEGTKLTSSLIKDRLHKETQSNVAIRVEVTAQKDTFKISGRGELQLGVLIENMRREGFELAVSPPSVIYVMQEGKKLEPIEEVMVDVDQEHIGLMIDRITNRKGELKDMKQSGTRARLTFYVPVRGLLGFRNEFITETRGTGVLNSSFHSYLPYKGSVQTARKGAIISMAEGITTTYALDGVQSRGTLFVGAQCPVYSGMIIGESAKPEDIECNPCKTKHLTNVRQVFKDDAIRLQTPRVLTLEQAISYIAEDELIEVTPKSIRLRKKELDENKRRRLKKASNRED
jgi:GTP-binding protein